MQIPIVYEDKDIIVINKPSDLLTHPKNKTDKSKSVVSWLLEKYPEIKNVGDPSLDSGQAILRPGIVHRLDKETSGLLIVAKTQSAFDYLKKNFQERKIKKIYSALVHGILKTKSGRIEIPLGKLGTRQTTRIHGKHELTEKTAITEYKVIKTYNLELTTYSLLEVLPLTGRTHQIRVHLKSIGHPIVCDPVYGGKKLSCPPGLGRLFLHAQKLSFVTPSGKALSLETDLPFKLSNFLKTLPESKN